MIDINELRQSAQAATPGPWYIGSGTYEGRNIYSVEAVTDDEGFTYNPVVATAEDDDVVCWEANARLIAAANPAVISELLDRLEAAEEERDTYKAVCNEWIAKTEWVQDELPSRKLYGKYLGMHRADIIKVEIDALRAAVRHEADCVDAAKAEIDALRAKIEEMEKQEPVRHEFQGRDGAWYPFINQRHYENTVADGTWPIRALYALPGAKGEEK